MKAVEIEFLMKGNLRQGMQEAGGEADVLDSRLRGLRNTVGGLFAVDKSAEYIKKMIDVRSEVESLQISFETLAGKTQGDKLFGDIKTFAAETPLMMNDLAKGAQTLLGFNIEIEKVMPILHQIGDISMGDSQRFNSLVLAFAQMSSTGKLMGQDLLQMINAGFNPLVVMAEKTGKEMSVLKQEMADGKISVDMVADAFTSAAGEGGKFHGMLEKQSKGMKGELSNLEGAWQDALNAMGESSEGVISKGIELTTAAVKNYDKLGTAILTVVAAYGEYKGTLMAVQALQNVITRQKAAIESDRIGELKTLVEQYKNALDTEAIQSETVATQANTAAKEGNRTAIDAEVAAMENELRVKLATAEANYNDATSEAAAASLRVEAAQEAVATAQAHYEAVLKSGNAEAIEAAETELNTVAAEANTAAKELQTARTTAATATTAKEAATTRLSTFQTQVDTIQKNANTRATGLWAAATRVATTAMQSLKAAFMSNPFGMALVAITSIIGLLSMFSSETDTAADATARFREKIIQEQSQLDTYYATLSNVEKGSKSYQASLDGINTLAKEYNTHQLSVNDTLKEQRHKYEELTEAIRRQTAEKTLAEAAAKANEDAMNSEKEAMDALVEEAKNATHKEMQEVIDDVDGVSVTTNKLVDVSSAKLRQITSATWNMISTEVMSHAESMSAAFARSQEGGTKAVQAEVKVIESLLASLGVTDKEIKGFHDNLYEYVETSAKGFHNSYGELERTKAQLTGIAAASVEVKDATNEAIDQMNYEQLVQKMQSVQAEIDNINAKEVKVATDNSRLLELKGLLTDINHLLPKALTSGSDADLEKRLQDLKKKRDATAYGSKEWKGYNTQIGTLSTTLTAHKNNYAESAGKAKGRKDDPAKQQAHYLEVIAEQKQARIRAVKDMEFETRQAEIDARDEGTKKILAQLQLDFDKEKEKIKRDYEELKKNKIEAAKKLWEANPKNKDKRFTYNPNDKRFAYTEAEKANRTAREDAALFNYTKKVEEQAATDRQAMNDYLKEYGSFYQQKLAIALEYAEKIRKANSEGERKKLVAEQEKAEGKAQAGQLKDEIDWSMVFSDLGFILKSQLEESLGKMREYRDTDAFKQLDLTEQKVVLEAISSAEKHLTTGIDSLDFNKLGTDIDRYERELAQLKAATEADAKAQANVKAMTEALAAAKKKGVSAEIEHAQTLLNTAQTAAESTAQAVKDTQSNVQKAAAKVRDGASAMFNSLNGLSDGLSDLSGGSLKGAWDGLTKIDKALNNGKITEAITSAVGKLFTSKESKDGIQAAAGKLLSNEQVQKTVAKALGKAFEGKSDLVSLIIGAILNILDLLKEQGIGGLVGGLVEAILEAIGGLLKNILSGKFVAQIGQALYEGIGSILNAITFGGFSSWFGADGNSKQVNELLDRLTSSNESLQKAIDALRERMEKAGGDRATDIYDQTLKAMEEKSANNRAMLEAKMGYHAAHHSNDYYISKTLSWEDYRRMEQKIKENLGHQVSLNGVSDIWRLSSEELAQLQELGDIWQKLSAGGKYDQSQWLEDYIDDYKEINDLQATWRESITATTFDNIRSSLNSLLGDYTKGTKDALKSVDEMFKSAINRSLTSGDYYNQLEAWYKKFAESMRNGLTKSEADELRNLYNQYYKEMAKRRDNAYKEAGIDATEGTSQTGRAGAFETMTQDQGTKLEGLFTSGQLHWASMDALLAKIADRWTAASDHLAELVENTSYCKLLKGMSEDIRIIKRDGIKMR